MTEQTNPAVLSVAADTAVLTIINPADNTPTSWQITMAGPGHPKTVALSARFERERLAKSAAIEQTQINGRKWTAEVPTGEENRRENVLSVIGRIVDWTPVDFGNGAISFSEDAAVELFLDPRKGAYFSQIVNFLTGEKAFFTNSAKV